MTQLRLALQGEPAIGTAGPTSRFSLSRDHESQLWRFENDCCLVVGWIAIDGPATAPELTRRLGLSGSQVADCIAYLRAAGRLRKSTPAYGRPCRATGKRETIWELI